MNGSYNGWTDMPEEEREALSAYEAKVGAAEAVPVDGYVGPLLRIKAAMRVLVDRTSRRAA